MARNIKNKVSGSLDTITTYDSDTGEITGLSPIGNVALGDIANVSILGGANGNVLTTDGNGVLSWGTGSAGVVIPAVYFVAPTTGNNQTFSNTVLASYTSNTDITLFFNGALLENDAYTLSGDTLTINTPLSAGDSIDVIRQFASNAINVTSAFGNSNVVTLLNTGLNGNIIPATNVLYSLGNATNQWKDLYVSNATIFMNNVPLSANTTALSYGNQQLVTTSSAGNIDTTGNITSNGTVSGNTVIAAVGLTAANANISGNLSAANATLANLTVTNSANLANATLDGTTTVLSALTTDDVISRTGDLTLSSIGTNQNITLNPSGTGFVDVSSSLIKNLLSPIDAQDAATKAYVDTFAQGLQTKASVQAATPDSLATITGGSVTYDNGAAGIGATLTLGVALTTLDGVTLNNGDRILVKNETSTADNGIYTWATGGTVLTRASDYDTPASMGAGTFVLVEEGTLYAATGWVQIDDVTTVGTDSIAFAQFSAAGTYTAGPGLTLTGSQFSVTDTTVTPGTYGNATETVSIAVNSRGQITSISQQPAAAGYGNAEVSAYLASATNTDGFSTSGDVVAFNIVADNQLSCLGTAQYIGDITAYSNILVGVDLAVTGNTQVLGNLNVDGRTTLGFINNIFIAGGTPGDIISTDGSGGLSWIPPYSNADVKSYLESSAAINYSSTGNMVARRSTFQTVSTTELDVLGGNASLGPVGNVRITGGTNGQVLTTNGSGTLSWQNSSAAYGNANVAAYLNSNTSIPITTTANITAGNITADDRLFANRISANSVLVGSSFLSSGGLFVSGNISGNNIVSFGNVTTANIAASGRTDLNSVGNITITGGSNGQVLTTDGIGGLSWAPTPSYRATANGNLTLGQPVLVNDDATLGPLIGIPTAIGSTVTMSTSALSQSTILVTAPGISRVLAVYSKSSSGSGHVKIGQVVSGNIVWGAEQTFALSGVANSIGAAWDTVNNVLVITYRDTSGVGVASIATVNAPADSISFSVGASFTSGAGINYSAITYDSVNQKMVISWAAGSFVRSCVGTISTGTISFGTAVNVYNSDVSDLAMAFDPVVGRVVIAWIINQSGNRNIITAVGSVSGTTISFGSGATITGRSEIQSITLSYDVAANRVVYTYIYFVTGQGLYGAARAVLINSNNTITLGGNDPEFQTPTAGTGAVSCYDSSARTTLIFFGSGFGGTPTYVTTATINNGIITYSNTATVMPSVQGLYLGAAHDPTSGYTVVAAQAGGSATYRPQFYNLTATNFIGFSAGAYANGTTATVNIVGSVASNFSGLIPGKEYYLQLTGTLSQTPGTPSVYAGRSVATTKLIVKG